MLRDKLDSWQQSTEILDAYSKETYQTFVKWANSYVQISCAQGIAMYKVGMLNEYRLID